jgi:predicted NBD/HSP70 family sugar kinase
MNISREIAMELLDDIGKMLSSVARDYVPEKHWQVQTNAHPTQPSVQLQIREPTNPEIEAVLAEFGKAVRETIDKVLPSFPVDVIVVGGSEAAGIVVQYKDGVDNSVIYGHIIKAKVDTLFASNYLKDKSSLVDKILKGITP